MNDVIVGVDRSETAHRAADTAAALAADAAANLHVVMCISRVEGGDISTGGDSWHVDSVTDAEHFLSGLAHQLSHDRITTAVLIGDPAKNLCEQAERIGARTIVVGNRRVQGLSRVLGSVAMDVVRHAPCDVLIANTTNTANPTN